MRLLKIIDEKGMLFGKINIIDFFVILFLLNLTPIFYFGYQIIRKQAVMVGIPPQEENLPLKDIDKSRLTYKELELKVDFRNLDSKILKIISIGDKETNELGSVIAQIVKLDSPEPEIYQLSISGEKKLFRRLFPSYHMLATLRVKVMMRQDNCYYKDTRILDSGLFEFITDKYKIHGEFLNNTECKRRDTPKPELPVVDYSKVESLNSKVESLNSQVESLNSKVESLNSKVESLNSKVESLNSKVESLNSQVESLNSKVESLNSQVSTLEKQVEIIFSNEDRKEPSQKKDVYRKGKQKEK